MPTQFQIHQTLTVETKSTPAPGILAYRCQLEDADAPSSSWEGLCDATDPPQRANWCPKPKQPWVCLHVLSIEALAKWGWSGQHGDHEELKLQSTKPFTELGGHEYQLVRLDVPSHMLFDSEGFPLVVAQEVDYLHWELTRQRYDIVKALRHLREHPHVTDLRVDQCPEALPGECFDAAFRWTPDLETYRRAWAECLKIDPLCPSTKFPHSARNLDLLGLTKAGCVWG